MLDSDSAIDTQQTTAENIVLINLIDFSLLIFCIQNVRIVCWWIYRWLTIITEDHKATYLHNDGYLHWTKKKSTFPWSQSFNYERKVPCVTPNQWFTLWFLFCISLQFLLSTLFIPRHPFKICQVTKKYLNLSYIENCPLFPEAIVYFSRHFRDHAISLGVFVNDRLEWYNQAPNAEERNIRRQYFDPEESENGPSFLDFIFNELDMPDVCQLWSWFERRYVGVDSIIHDPRYLQESKQSSRPVCIQFFSSPSPITDKSTDFSKIS